MRSANGGVADRKVEAAAERAAGVVLAAHAGFWVDEGGNASGDRVVFHPGQACGVA